MRNLRNGKLQIGDIAPDFTLFSVEGQPISLSDILYNRTNVLVVFLRHLG
jgi:peroxiredoxin